MKKKIKKILTPIIIEIMEDKIREELKKEMLTILKKSSFESP